MTPEEVEALERPADWNPDTDGWWMTVRATCRTCRKQWVAIAPAICTRFKCPRVGCRGWAILS